MQKLIEEIEARIKQYETLRIASVDFEYKNHIASMEVALEWVLVKIRELK